MDELEQERINLPGDDSPPGNAAQLPLWPPEPVSSAALSDSPAAPPPEPEPPWSLADVGLFILFAVGSFLVLNLLAALAFLAFEQQFAWHANVREVFTRTPFLVLMQTGLEVVWLLFIYFIITSKYRRPFWEAVQWRTRPGFGTTYLMAGAGLAVAAQFLPLLFPSEKQLPIERLFSSAESAYLLAVFGIGVAPFVEELIFRGFFYPVFERLWGLTRAVLLTASLFACVHIPTLWGGWHEIAAIFLVGAGFSYCRGKTGSLVPPYLMHLGYNATLFVALYFTTDRFQNLKG